MGFRLRKSVKVLSLLAALSLFFFALSEYCVWASVPNTEKEEVVYVNLNHDGSVDEINVVNIFDSYEGEKIIDYGNYESLRNMTTTDEIDYRDETVTVNASEDKLYYEGKLKSSIIPWDIDIRYFIDGKIYSGEEVAGMSGALKILIDVSKNQSCLGDFFENYAIQLTVVLDTNICGSISAEGATTANSGSDKQLTYTILPGKGDKIEITADVSDFKMDSVSINCIPLNLDLEIDDSDLIGQVNELLDALKELDGGSDDIYEGISQLKEGVDSSLGGGVSELNNGAADLFDGSAKLKDGGEALEAGVTELESGTQSIDEGIESLNDGIVKMQDSLNQLDSNSEALKDGSSKFKQSLEKLQSALNGISFAAEDIEEISSSTSALENALIEIKDSIGAICLGVSTDAYKEIMSSNGLDIDTIKKNNEAAADQIGGITEELQSYITLLKAYGLDTADLEEKLRALSSVSELLMANNYAIIGTETYISSVSEKLLILLEGIETIQSNYEIFDLAISDLTDTLTNLAYKMSELKNAVDELVSGYEELDGSINSYADAVSSIAEGYSEICDGSSRLLSGSSSLASGSEELYKKTGDLLNGISEIYNGSGTLYDASGELNDGVSELLADIVKLYNGTGELKNGISEIYGESSDMDEKISEKIDELIKSVTGNDVDTGSFVSDKNTNVDYVQFVIKTPSIEKVKDIAQTQESETPTGFWQKLLKLFGL